MDILRESFQRVRQDIDSLKIELGSLNLSLVEMVWKIDEMNNSLKELNESLQKKSKDAERPLIIPSTHIIQIPLTSTDSSTDNLPFNAHKPQKQPLSIRNEGVPTDRQTDPQTDTYKAKISERRAFASQEIPIKKDPIKDAADILDSLDALKKEIRLKFKRLTNREWSVFSTMYQLEEENGYSDYKSIAEKLNLTESSIRDYVARLLGKGIPVDKTKLNNKNIQFKISDSLKKIATLPTIMQLRDL